MLTRNQMYGRAAVGGVISFLVTFLATIMAFGAELTVALPVAAAVGLVGGAGIYLWLRTSTDQPDPMLG